MPDAYPAAPAPFEAPRLPLDSLMYSDATVALVAQALWDKAVEGRPVGRPTPQCFDDARAALDVLFAAGLLLPEGAETRTERHYSPAHDGLVERRVITTRWVPASPDAVGQRSDGQSLSRDVSAGQPLGLDRD